MAKQVVMITTKRGKALKFDMLDIRSMGRTAKGVTGITLTPPDVVVDMTWCLDVDTNFVLTVTRLGRAKRTAVTDFPLRKRGGAGVFSFDCTKKTGSVVKTAIVTVHDEVMLQTAKGKTIRLAAKAIRETKRVATGVSLISLSEGDHVTDISIIPKDPK